MNQRIAIVSDEKLNLEQLLSEKDDEISSLSLKLKSITDGNDHSLTELKTQLSNYEALIQDLESTISEKDSEVQQSDQKLSGIVDQIKAVTEAKTELEKLLEEKDTEISNLSQNLSQLRSEDSVTVSQLKDQLNSYESAISNLKAEIAQKEAELLEIQDNSNTPPLDCSSLSPSHVITFLKQSLSANDQQLDQVRSQLDSLYLETNIVDFDDQVSKLEAQSDELSSVSQYFTDLITEIRTRGTVPQRLVAEISTLANFKNQVVTDSSVDLEELKAELAEKELENSKLSELIQKEKQSMNQRIAVDSDEKLNLEQLLSEKDDQISSLSLKLKSITDGNDHSLTELKTQLLNYEALIQDLESTISEKDSEVQQSDQKLSGIVDQIKAVTEAKTELEKLLEEKDTEISNLSQNLSQLRSEDSVTVSQLKDQLNSYESAISNLKAEIAQKEAELLEIQDNSNTPPLDCSSLSPSHVITFLKQSLSANDQQLDQVRSQLDSLYLETNIVDFDDQVSKLEAQSDELSSVSQYFTDLITEIRTRGTVPQRLVAEISTLANFKNQVVTDSSVDLEELKAELAEKELENSKLSELIQKEKQSMNQRIAVDSDEKLNLEQLLSEKDDQISSLSLKLKSITDGNDHSLTELKTQLLNYEALIQDLESTISEKDSEVQQSDQKLSGIVDQIKAVTEAKTELEKLLEEKDTEISNLESTT
ncbi:hypothetical protein GEMRC1_007526 [Eukaryota sp. GEM-RC1]